MQAKPHSTKASLNSGAFLLDSAEYFVKSVDFIPEFHKFGKMNFDNLWRVSLKKVNS